MNKAKIIWTSIGIIALVGGIVAGLLLVQKQQDIREKAAPATSLSVTPGSQSKTPGQTFTQSVVMDTGANQVSGVQFEINFDPQAVEVTGIQKGSGIASLDQEIKNEINNTTGRISYSAFTLNSSNWVNGQGLSALTITAKVKDSASSGTYQTGFAGTTAVSASGEGQNVVTGTTPGTLTVSVVGQNPTPTSAPTTAPTQPGSTTSPTATSQSAGNPTTVPTKTATSKPAGATATAPPLPETGTSWPTYLGAGVGILIILASLVLAL